MIPKVWLVAQYHFRQETGKRSFFFLLLMLPLMLVLTVGVGYLNSQAQRTRVTLGYVDPDGLLVRTALSPDDRDVQLAAFVTRADAQTALETGRIAAYYVLSDSHTTPRQAEFIYYEPPHYSAIRYFHDVVRLNLMTGQPPAIVERVLSGPNTTIRVTTAGREFPAGEVNATMFAPLVAAMMIIFLTLTTSGYMMEALVAEKENRTIEVIVSSISPAQMMTGKIIGALGIALLQLTVWLAFLVGAVWLGSSVLDIAWLQDIRPNWPSVLAVATVALPAYLFMSALMTAVGATLVEVHEADQAGPFFFISMFLPLYLALPIFQHPDSPLSVGLSLFPVTAVTTMAMRSLFSQVPTWQVAASAAIASACAGLAIWLASKALRISLLHYGQRLTWREFFARRRAGSARI